VNSFYTSVRDDNAVASKFINFNLPQYYQIVYCEEGGEPYIVPYRNDGATYVKPIRAVNA